MINSSIDEQKNTTISSSTINYGIFSNNIYRDENYEISSFDDNINSNEIKSETEYFSFISLTEGLIKMRTLIFHADRCNKNNRLNSFPYLLNSNLEQLNHNFMSKERIESEIDDEELKNKILFIDQTHKDIFKTSIVLKKKRGRKEGQINTNKQPSLKYPKKIYIKNKKIIIHDKTKQDNLQRKIHSHFLSFLINVSNDAIKSENKIKDQKLNFKNIDYKIKQKIDEKNFKKIKSLSLKEILEMNISPKFSTFKNDENKKTVNKICKLSDWINHFFKRTYLDLLGDYRSEKKINKIIFKGKEIFFSKKTKSFYDLLNKKGNEYIKEQLKDVLYRVFFCEMPKVENDDIKFITDKNK